MRRGFEEKNGKITCRTSRTPCPSWCEGSTTSLDFFFGVKYFLKHTCTPSGKTPNHITIIWIEMVYVQHSTFVCVASLTFCMHTYITCMNIYIYIRM